MNELKKYKMFIGGEWVESDTKKTFETLNPEDNKPWAIVPEASANDVDKAVKAAQKAFEGEWPKLLPRERAKFLRAIGNKLRNNAELLGKIETVDTGKLFRETNKQANYIAEYYDYYAGLADTVEGTVLPIDKTNIQAITTRIPIGVIAAIVPWNSCCYRLDVCLVNWKHRSFNCISQSCIIIVILSNVICLFICFSK
jgi:aldehyde dehydrogenase (NAD+)/betaine-aldehyde dehydrogenase